MDKKDVLEILESWNFWSKDQELGVVREDYVDRVLRKIRFNPIPFVTGVRRCGKSFILRQTVANLIASGVPRKNILFINFEDPRFITDLDAKFLQNIYQIYLEQFSPQGQIYIFLDEVQKVYRWEQWVRMMHELNKAKIIVSGSNSALLSPEFGTALTGRHDDVIVYPFSYKEYSKYKRNSVPHTVENYLLEGGFPEIVLEKAEPTFLLTYFQDILLKDLILRFKIRGVEKIRSLARYLLSNPASLISFTKTGEILKMSPTSTIKFSSYLETAFLVFFTNRFSWKVREQEKSLKKDYVIDTGLAKAIGFFPEKSLGYLAENAVYLELLRRTLRKDEIYYFKDLRQREVDFITRNDKNQLDAIQVCYDLNRPEVREREIKSLLSALNELNLPSGTILGNIREGEEKINGKTIEFIPLESWLVGD